MNFLTRKDVLWIGVLALVLLVVLPLGLETFRLNLFGKYLTYGFVVLGLVLCWGDAGILSLGQGVFFGLGGYCMAMFLKLEASTPENTKIQSTPGIPDFMDWNQITELPVFWQPFHNLPFTLLAVVLVPALLAFVIGVAMFTRRVCCSWRSPCCTTPCPGSVSSPRSRGRCRASRPARPRRE